MRRVEQFEMLRSKAAHARVSGPELYRAPTTQCAYLKRKIKIVVDDIKIAGLFHQVADVQAFQHFGILRAVFLVALFTYRVKFSGGNGISCGE